MNAVPPAFPQLAERFAAQRQAFAADPNPPLAARRERLDRLLELIDNNEDALVAAVDADFGGRAAQETRIAELFVTRSAILYARRRLARWMRRAAFQPVAVPAGAQSPRAAAARRRRHRLAVELPDPVDALSAGRGAGGGRPRAAQAVRADAAHFGAARRAGGEKFRSRSRQRRRRRRRDRQGLRRFAVRSSVVHRLDRRRRQVAAAAAANLTPVTLELGGKSPANLRRLLRSRPGERARRRRQAVQRRPDLHRARLSAGSARPGRRGGGGDGGGDGAPLSEARRQPRLHRDHQRAPSQPPRRPRRRGARSGGADHRDRSGRRKLRRQRQAGADGGDRSAAIDATDAGRDFRAGVADRRIRARSRRRSPPSIAASGQSRFTGSAATRRGASACCGRRSPAA